MREVPPWQRDARICSAATAYARLGFALLPLHGVIDGSCSCGDPDCSSPGKHPLIDGGFHGATDDLATVEAWFQNRANANLGLRPGPSNIIIFDIDPRNGGDAAWDKWLEAHGPDPDTVEVITGSGGRHIYLRIDTPVRNQKLGGDFYGIDVICATGYVVAPPSKHISGRRYEWSDDFDLADLSPLDGDPFARIPDAWLAALNTAPATVSTPGNREAPILSAPPVGDLERVREALFTLSADSYHDWIKYGQILHQTCWYGSFELWLEWSQTSDKFKDENDCRRKWQTFDKNGAAGLGTLFAATDASSLGRQGAGMLHAPAVPTTFVTAGDFAAAFKPPDYIVDGVVISGRLHAFTGHSNAGKTAIGIEMACAVALGRDFATATVKQSRVLFLAGENAEDVRGRFRGWCEMNKIDAADLNKPIHILPQAGPIEGIVQSIIDYSEKVGGFGLVIVDSKLPYFGGDDENDNTQAIAQAKQFRALCEQATGKPAVIVLGHPRKGASSQDELLPRGGGAYFNEIDTNLSAWSDGTLSCVHWTAKIRGPSFEPLYFKMQPQPISDAIDSQGRVFSTVVAIASTGPERSQEEALQDENHVLREVARGKGKLSVADIARAIGKLDERGNPQKSSVQKILKRLQGDKLVHQPRKSGHFCATKKGQDTLDFLPESTFSRSPIVHGENDPIWTKSFSER